MNFPTLDSELCKQHLATLIQESTFTEIAQPEDLASELTQLDLSSMVSVDSTAELPELPDARAARGQTTRKRGQAHKNYPLPRALTATSGALQERLMSVHEKRGYDDLSTAARAQSNTRVLKFLNK